MSHKVATKSDIAQIASISSADKQVGDLIADAMEKVGNDGVITIEESRGVDTSMDVVEGMQLIVATCHNTWLLTMIRWKQTLIIHTS